MVIFSSPIKIEKGAYHEKEMFFGILYFIYRT